MFLVVKTLTFDNCKEFAEHARMDETLSSATCFANSFCSWQRGSNENFNDLLSQYMPKKKPLSTLIDKELKMIELKLNHQLLKRLGLKTSNGVFTQSLSRVAVYV
jgi:IS30 family transposase